MTTTKYQTLQFDVTAAVATITLSRPRAMNALSEEVVAELVDAVQTVATRDDIRVLIITGAGTAFCCGADLKNVLQQLVSGDTSVLVRFAGQIQAAFQSIREMEKPTIAAINGLALAGGLELAMACDLIIATESARLGDAHSNFGVLPGAGGGTLLPRFVGEKKAKYLLYTGEHLPASEFEKMGLISRIVKDGTLQEEVTALATRLAFKSPLVLQRMKQLVSRGASLDVRGALKLELQTLEAHAGSKDILEGLRAFSEKRKPRYSGE